MSLTVAGLVLCAALLHAFWNALLKSCADKVAMQTLVVSLPAVICLPFLLTVKLPTPEAWAYLVISMITHGLYYVTLIMSYRFGELSKAYPMARGSAPLLIALGAWWLADEPLRAVQWFAIGILSAGLVSLADLRRLDGAGAKAAFFALATGVSIAAYSVADGLGVRSAETAISYVLWLIVLEAVPMVAIGLWLRRGRMVASFAPYLGKGVLGGIALGVGYGVVIWAMGEAPMAEVSALREISVIMATVIGICVLKEPLQARRIIAAGLVCAGNVLLHLGK